MKAYARSKLALVLFTQELAERLKDTDITANSFVSRPCGNHIWNLLPEHKWYQAILRLVERLILISEQEGAQTGIYLACSDEVKGITGKYFCKKKAKNYLGQMQRYQTAKGVMAIKRKVDWIIRCCVLLSMG